MLIPRRYSSLIQGTLSAEYAITGGNDMRLRYWDLKDPENGSYFINTPANDECQYFSEIVPGGVKYIHEQISRVKNFPLINGNMMHTNNLRPNNKLVIPGTNIEMRSDSIYYSVLAGMI